MEYILVTGGAGYVGSGLLRELLSQDYSVTCVDNLMFGGESLLDIWHNKNFNFIKCDGKYDYVLSLSALKYVHSEEDPFTLMRMIDVNIFNTDKTIRQSIENSKNIHRK